ncbi:MAG: hypothetical protein CL424_12100 [Acidimicrobiaceae bacterium]|nr:hypothetical protein [Acidimicrobiaceae bacterium]
MTGLDQGRIVGALRDEWASIDELISGLDDEQWSWPSPLPGWDVRSNVVHIIGTEAMLLGRTPSVEPVDSVEHVKNPIGAANEAWIATYADRSPTELVEEFRTLTTERLRVLGAMSEDEWNEVGFTPAGEGPYGRFMQIRVFDCWMHEQDIRYAIRMPGHEHGRPVDVSLDEMSNAMGYVVGKKAGAPTGSSVTFDLRGATSRRIHVQVGERAQVVDELAGQATTTLVMPVISFAHIAGGRLDREIHVAHCEIEGDQDLGRRVLENLPYTI